MITRSGYGSAAVLRLKALSAVLILLLLVAGCAGTRRGEAGREEPGEPAITLPGTGGAPVVRILLLETDDRIRVMLVAGEVEARSVDGQSLGRFRAEGTLSISRKGRGLRLRRSGGPQYEAPVMEIRPEAGTYFELDGTAYRGGLLLTGSRGKAILAINLVEIDEYLKGVLPSEIGFLEDGQFAAYEAQAIASRSYALSKLEEKAAEPYDLRATIMDQVYKGVGGENRRASEAVERTRGVVGIWKGKPIKAYYSSCCGGHTADIRVGWPWKAHYPYLHGIRDSAGEGGGSFCRNSSRFRWEVEWSGSDLARILDKTLRAELGDRVSRFNVIRDMKVDSYAPSGRARAVVVVTDRGTYTVEGDRVRWVLRPRSAEGQILRSTLFKMEVERSGGRVRRVRLKGGGNGHGVGMCQSGAITMASSGFSAERILTHYYPGISLERIYR